MDGFRGVNWMDITAALLVENDDGTLWGKEFDNDLGSKEALSSIWHGPKIVELSDIGCDALVSGQSLKNTSVIFEKKSCDDRKKNKVFGQNPKCNDIDGSNINNKVRKDWHIKEEKRGINPGDELERFDNPDDNSLSGIAKKFVNRAVDSDSLSDYSRYSIEIESSELSIFREHDNNNKLRNTDYAKSEDMWNNAKTRAKRLPRQFNSVNQKTFASKKFGVDNNRFKLNRRVSSGKSKKEQVIETNSNKPKSVKRTIIKKKPVKSFEGPLEFMASIKSYYNDKRRSFAKLIVKDSKLPVWQGWHLKSKDLSNMYSIERPEEIVSKNIEELIGTDELMKNEVLPIFSKIDVISNSKIDQDEFGADESTEEDNNNSLKLEHGSEEPDESNRLNNLVESTSEAYINAKTNTVMKSFIETQAEPNVSMEMIKLRENQSKTQSISELWTENYEKAYEKGRVIGRKICRLAQAMREAGREFGT